MHHQSNWSFKTIYKTLLYQQDREKWSWCGRY